MKMHRISALILAAAFAAATFAGCSGTGNAPSAAPSSASGSMASNENKGSTLPELPNNTLTLTIARPQFNEAAEGKPVPVSYTHLVKPTDVGKLQRDVKTIFNQLLYCIRPVIPARHFPNIPICYADFHMFRIRGGRRLGGRLFLRT